MYQLFKSKIFIVKTWCVLISLKYELYEGILHCRSTVYIYESSIIVLLCIYNNAAVRDKLVGP